MEARPAREPSLDFGMLVRAIVVNDQMHIEQRWHASIEMAQKAQELLMAMSRFALGEHTAVGNVESGEQGGSPVTVIIVRDALRVSDFLYVSRFALNRLLAADHEPLFEL